MRLTKTETIYAFATLAAVFAILTGILTFWFHQTTNCWNLYANEQQAIQECEQ
jgi:hypothetical protein